MSSLVAGKDYAGVCSPGYYLQRNGTCTLCTNGYSANPQQTQCVFLCGADAAPYVANDSNAANSGKEISQCFCANGYEYDVTRNICNLTIVMAGKLTALVAGGAIILVLCVLGIHIINEKIIKREEEKKQFE